MYRNVHPFFNYFCMYKQVRIDYENNTSMYAILYRPVGPDELELVKQSGWKKFPPRKEEQPLFYPVCNSAYARQIAKDWNVPAYGSGYVLRFDVELTYLNKYVSRNVGGDIHWEYWIPADELEEFNQHIYGTIKLIHSYYKNGEELIH